jgi:hypothetical protein
VVHETMPRKNKTNFLFHWCLFQTNTWNDTHRHVSGPVPLCRESGERCVVHCGRLRVSCRPLALVDVYFYFKRLLSFLSVGIMVAALMAMLLLCHASSLVAAQQTCLLRTANDDSSYIACTSDSDCQSFSTLYPNEFICGPSALPPPAPESCCVDSFPVFESSLASQGSMLQLSGIMLFTSALIFMYMIPYNIL